MPSKPDQYSVIIDMLEDVARRLSDLEDRVAEAINNCMGRHSYSHHSPDE